MSEIGKDAMEKAERIVSHLASERKWGVHEARDHIATALQQLMDERDLWKRRAENLDIEHASLSKFGANRQFVLRAEAAEEKLADAHATFAKTYRRAELAEAKLAELVRRVDGWYWTAHRGVTGSESLRAILAEYEVKP